MLRTDATTPDFAAKPLSFLGAHTAYRQLAQAVIVLCDFVMVALAFGLAYWLRFHGGLTIASDAPLEPAKYLGLIAVLIPVWLIIFWLMQLYDYHLLLGGIGEYTRALNACTNGMMAVVLVSFLVPEFQIARGWLVFSWVFSCVFVCAGRFTMRRIGYRLRRAGYFVTPALIVGSNQEALALANQLRDRCASGLGVLGLVDAEGGLLPGGQHRSIGGFPVVGDLPSLPEIVNRHGVREVIIVGTALTDAQRVEVLERLINLPGVDLRLSSGLYEILTTSVYVTTRNSVPLITLNRLRLNRLEATMKSLLDVAIILLTLPLLLAVFAVIAILIKLDSPGAVFHHRRVLGINGKEFNALKFRTMVENGDDVLAQYPELLDELHQNHKLKHDPRITRVGGWLRRTSLDELPQLMNVLRGQMSLVGPRMISPPEAELYGTMHLNLLTVKPGLTGLWQVSGRSNLSYEERVRLDMHYIRNYSIWLDLQILFVQTLPAVLGKRGAY